MNSEPKKIAAMRREMNETNDMLLWMLNRIDKRNDDAIEAGEPPICPEPDMACRGNCTSCWFSAALKGVHHGEA